MPLLLYTKANVLTLFKLYISICHFIFLNYYNFLFSELNTNPVRHQLENIPVVARASQGRTANNHRPQDTLARVQRDATLADSIQTQPVVEINYMEGQGTDAIKSHFEVDKIMRQDDGRKYKFG